MTEPSAERDPLWIRILEFPLVALVVATGLYIIASVTAYRVLAYVPAVSSDVKTVLEMLLNVAFLWLVYKLVIRHLGDKPHDDLPLPGSVRLTGEGVVFGFVLFSLIVAAAAVAGAYRITGPGDFAGMVGSIAGFAILPGFREELLFRGILFRWIEEFGGTWAALAVTSALFGIVHIGNPNATWFSSFCIAVEAGILLGGAYMVTRSLWFPIGLHAAWNFTQGEIFDVPVSGLDSNGLVVATLRGPDWLSGGTFGLEASIVALLVATAAGVWLVVRAAQRGLVYGPMWTRKGALVLKPERSAAALLLPDRARRAD